MNYFNEEHVLRDNEIMDIDGTDYEEAPCDANIIISGVGVIWRSR
jgi:hypothetical protein